MIWGADLGSRKVTLFSPVSAVTATSPSTDRGSALRSLRVLVEEVLAVDPDPVIFVEEPPKVRNMRTFLHLAQTCGMVMSLPAPTYCVPVASWKKATVGNGHASKEDVASWLSEEHPAYYDLCGADQDKVDAACIHLYGGQVLALGERGLGLGGPD